MSKTLNLTNLSAAAPAFAMSAVGLNVVRFHVSDGLGNEVTLNVPRSQAKNIANALNGTVSAQVREELEICERDGTLTEAQTRKLAKIREAAERTAQMNAQRSADAAARRAAKEGAGKGKLKAVVNG